ncbi:MAG: hypothetical protein QXM71_08655 [Thermofilum sp.]
MRQFRVKGVKCSLFTLCLSSPVEVAPRELAQQLRSILDRDEWVVVLSSCELVPPEDVLLSPCMYAVRAYLARTMISEWLEIEVLLYLLGERNIRSAVSLLAEKPGRQLGLICLTLRDPKALESKIREFSLRRGFKLHAVQGDGWVKHYAEYFNLKSDNPEKLREATARTLRARAALLTLEAQR